MAKKPKAKKTPCEEGGDELLPWSISVATTSAIDAVVRVSAAIQANFTLGASRRRPRHRLCQLGRAAPMSGASSYRHVSDREAVLDRRQSVVDNRR